MKTYDLIVIGAGPGGYVAAIRASQLGMKTAIVEKAHMGGMCLNWGCVPARRFMESARAFERVKDSALFGIDGVDVNVVRFNWKRAAAEKDKIVSKLVKGVEFLMKRNKIDVISGEAKLVGGTQVVVGSEKREAGKIIIATGSRPDRTPVAMLPAELVIEVDDFFARETIPDRIVVAGGDTVACEMASLLALIGKQVTMVAPETRLMGWLDESLSGFVIDKFKKSGVRVLLGAAFMTGSKDSVAVAGEKIECDVIVNCSRRKAVLPLLENTYFDVENDAIAVNDFMQTGVPSVYAVGDVTGQIFAHVASAQAMCAVNHIAGLKEPVDMRRTPVTIFMDPEIGSVGQTEDQLRAAGVEYIKGEFPMSVNSKALVEGNVEGFVKILAEPHYGEVLGVHVVAERATDLISEAVMCMKTEGTLDDLTRVVHAHPTVSETFLEAGFKAAGKPLHM
jgi:dihydrolipoamide dehydrogenase